MDHFNQRRPPAATVYVRGTAPEEVKDAKPYSQKFLHPKKRFPPVFLSEISYQIDLGLLYEIKSTTFYHGRMQYVGVVLQIQDKLLQNVYNGTYLLQVWQKGGEKVYERIMQGEVTMWQCYGATLLYKSPPEDEFSDCITIVDLKNPAGGVRHVKNFSIGMEKNRVPFQYLFFGNNQLWVGSKNLVLVASVPEQSTADKIEIAQEKICVYDPQAQVWGFYPGEASFRTGEFDIVFETPDKQLDFNAILADRVDPENFIPIVKQKRDIVDRKGEEAKDFTGKEIEEVAVLYTWEGECYAMSMLKGGKCDFYWNMSRLCSNNNRNLIEEICFSESHFFYRRKQEKVFNQIDLSLKSQINIDIPTECDMDFNKKVSIFGNVKSFVNIFHYFSLIKNTCYVVHGRILSQFNIIQKQWTAHLLYEDEIKFLFRYNNRGVFQPCILLANGKVFNDIDTPEKRQDRIMDMTEESADVVLEDTIIKIFPDQEDAEKMFYMAEDPLTGEVKMKILKGVGVTEVEGIQDFKPDGTVVISFSEADNTQFLYKQFQRLTLYELLPFKEGQAKAQVKVVHQINAYEVAQILTLNSAFSLDCHAKVCMADQKCLYLWDIKNKKIRTLYNHNVKGIFFFDEQYVYTLSLPYKGRQGGLRLYEATGLLEGQEDSYLLCHAAIGCSGQIDYNRANARLAFQKSAEKIEIIPLLHRNSLNFLGMPDRNRILATRSHLDKFTVLTTDKELITWDVTTGKLLFAKDSDIDVDGYQVAMFQNAPTIYTSHHYEAVLLRENKKLEGVDGTEFYSNFLNNSNTTIKYQRSFIECTEKDFYNFQLIKIVAEREAKILRKFVFPQYRSSQRVYFSEDYNLMFEELENKIVNLYAWYQEGEESYNGKFVMAKRLHKYPDQIEPKTPFLTLNSPNFEKYIEFDEALDRWVLMSTREQKRLAKIPKEALYMNGKEDASLMIRRFKWVDNRYFKYLTPGGIERMIDTEGGFKEVNYNVVQDVNTADPQVKHFYDCPDSLEDVDVLASLGKIQNLYKSAYFLEQKRQTPGKKKTRHQKAVPAQNGLYPIMFSVDKGNLAGNYQQKFRAQHSFSFLDWKIIQEIETGVRRAEEIDIPQLERISRNILPGGITILHILADNPESLQKIFELSQPNPEDREEFQFEIPYVMDFQGKGFLDLCAEREDMKTLNMSLEFLRGYGLDHHSRAINPLMTKLVLLPNFVPYIDSRLQMTNVTASIKRGAINDKSKGLTVSHLQIDKDNLMSKIFNRRASIEQEVTVEILDLPKIHDYQEPISDTFFKRLSKMSNFDIFSSTAVQKLIDFKYKLVRKYTMQRLFYPFALFQGCFFFYTSQIKMMFLRDQRNYPLFLCNYTLQCVLFSLSLYFLQNQGTLLRMRGAKHLKEFWNIIDIINPALVLVMLINFYVDDDRLQVNTWETIMSAFSTFTMWAKQLYFLRVFDAYSYLIRMIKQVVEDMKEFLVVLMLAIVAFSDTYRTISDGNTEENRFVDGTFDSFLMAYKMALGDFDTDDFGEVAVPMCIFFFFLCTVFNMIVMFNLLIAIISETFTNVKENATYAGFQERANMVAENSYLVPAAVKAVQCEDNQFLVIAREKGEESQESKNPLVGKVDNLQKLLKDNVEELKELLNQQDETIEAIFNHHGLKKVKPEEAEEVKGQGGAMSGTLSKGLASAFGLVGLGKKGAGKKSQQRLLMGMTLGQDLENESSAPNIDPHKILGQILAMGMEQRRRARSEGKDPNATSFVNEELLKKQKEANKTEKAPSESTAQPPLAEGLDDLPKPSATNFAGFLSQGGMPSVTEVPAEEDDAKSPLLKPASSQLEATESVAPRESIREPEVVASVIEETKEPLIEETREAVVEEPRVEEEESKEVRAEPEVQEVPAPQSEEHVEQTEEQPAEPVVESEQPASEPAAQEESKQEGSGDQQPE